MSADKLQDFLDFLVPPIEVDGHHAKERSLLRLEVREKFGSKRATSLAMQLMREVPTDSPDFDKQIFFEWLKAKMDEITF